MAAAAVHHTPYAGSWYPGSRRELEEMLGELFAKSAERTGSANDTGATAFVVPHAGLTYSGQTAAAVYRRLAHMRPETVVILGFAHRGAPAGVWLPEVESYGTPLGEVAVDGAKLRRLADSGAFRTAPESALCDHSIEIQLPLLQKASPQARVVPVYVSATDAGTRRRAAEALAGLAGPGTVFLASSDFTHFGDSFGYKPFPVDSRTPMRLRLLDEEFIEAAGSIDPEFLLETLRSQSATVCGREPIALMLEMLRRLPEGDDYFQRTLDYMTSGDLTGDYSHCVSYAALGYYPWSALQLSDEDAQLLLDSALATLRHYQQTGEAKPIPPERTTPALERSAGAFVTLHKNGALRGCVGRVTASEPLAQVVPEMTLAAALEDTRFEPLRPDEKGIELEISVLSPMKRLPEPSRFRVGIDGGYLKAGAMSGLLLPQVAEGRNWTAGDFLSALARKAGVSPDVYARPETRLYVFRAQIIP